MWANPTIFRSARIKKNRTLEPQASPRRARLAPWQRRDGRTCAICRLARDGAACVLSARWLITLILAEALLSARGVMAEWKGTSGRNGHLVTGSQLGGGIRGDWTWRVFAFPSSSFTLTNKTFLPPECSRFLLSRSWNTWKQNILWHPHAKPQIWGSREPRQGSLTLSTSNWQRYRHTMDSMRFSPEIVWRVWSPAPKWSTTSALFHLQMSSSLKLLISLHCSEFFPRSYSVMWNKFSTFPDLWTMSDCSVNSDEVTAPSSSISLRSSSKDLSKALENL